MNSSDANRRFGLSLAALCGVFALVPLLRTGTPGYIALALAVISWATSLLRPQWLNIVRLAFAFISGQLHRVMSPIFLGLIFFLVFVPGGFVLRRIFGIDLLGLRRDPKALSYWVRRDSPAGKSAGMKDQF